MPPCVPCARRYSRIISWARALSGSIPTSSTPRSVFGAVRTTRNVADTTRNADSTANAVRRAAYVSQDTEPPPERRAGSGSSTGARRDRCWRVVRWNRRRFGAWWSGVLGLSVLRDGRVEVAVQHVLEEVPADTDEHQHHRRPDEEGDVALADRQQARSGEAVDAED